MNGLILRNKCLEKLNSIDGDCRVFGRFYLATGSNGVKYGEPIGDAVIGS